MPSVQTPSCVTNIGQVFLTPGSGTALSNLPNSQSLDLIQILGAGGDVLIKVSSTGVVTQNPATSTTECLFERQFSRLASTATVAQIFADAYRQNNANSDVIQVRTQGGAGVWHLDYLGVSYNS